LRGDFDQGGKRVINQVRKLRWIELMVNNLLGYEEFKNKINFAFFEDNNVLSLIKRGFWSFTISTEKYNIVYH